MEKGVNGAGLIKDWTSRRCGEGGYVEKRSGSGEVWLGTVCV